MKFINFYNSLKKFMIKNQNDPTGLGFFSRCARTTTRRKFKDKKVHEVRSQQRGNFSQLEKINSKKVVCPFEMVESRQQRQKKYKNEETPGAGHYNVKIGKRVKLTWDILKAYNHKTRKKDKSLQNINVALVEEQMKQAKEEQFVNERSNKEVHEEENKIKKKTHSKRNKFIYQSDRSMVNMQKMVGRSQKNRSMTQQQISTLSHESIDLNKSIQAIKLRTSQNINFRNQISREKVESLNQSSIHPSYNYDIELIRKKDPNVVPFKKMIGRKEKKRNMNYSYEHYDFNEYVWKGNSKVYSNTKVNITDFSHQLPRRYETITDK